MTPIVYTIERVPACTNQGKVILSIDGYEAKDLGIVISEQTLTDGTYTTILLSVANNRVEFDGVQFKASLAYLVDEKTHLLQDLNINMVVRKTNSAPVFETAIGQIPQINCLKSEESKDWVFKLPKAIDFEQDTIYYEF